MFKQRSLFKSRRPVFCSMLLASVLLTVASLGIVSAHAQGVARSSNTQTPPPAVIFGPGKLNVVPSAAWLLAKNEHRIVVHNRQVIILSSSPNITYPSVDILPYTPPYGVSGETYEPPPTSTDSAGNSYNDGYYGNFCAAGASTVTRSYWSILTHAGSQGLASDWAGGQNLSFTKGERESPLIYHWG